MLQSGITTGDDKGKQPEKCVRVRKAPTKEPEFDLERAKETFMEASTSGSKDKLEPVMDPSMLTIVLETCMKMLRDNKEVKRL